MTAVKFAGGLLVTISGVLMLVLTPRGAEHYISTCVAGAIIGVGVYMIGTTL